MRFGHAFVTAPAVIALLVVAGCGDQGPGSAATSPSASTAPVRTGVWRPGNNNDLAFYVETVTASPGESKYGKAAPAACSQTNFFARGERVVWHIAVVDAKNGSVVLPEAVQSATLVIPGTSGIGITFVKHGKTDTSPWTWNAAWDIPPDYPLGVVPFQVNFQLNGWQASKVATFTQIPISLEQMTVIDHR
jgi:hypothetical protein